MNYAIILAAGKGSRCNIGIPKQFALVGGKTILEYTIDVFSKNKNTDRIILVAPLEYFEFCKSIKCQKIYKVVQGGKKRQDSSRTGTSLIEENDSKVLIHDGARPFVSDELINRCYLALDKYDAVNTGIETTDTIMEVDSKNIITNIPDRRKLLRCQTPQGFRAGVIKKAHEIALKNHLEVTDDAGLILQTGLCEVFVIKGEIQNIKITYENDIKEFAKKIQA